MRVTVSKTSQVVRLANVTATTPGCRPMSILSVIALPMQPGRATALPKFHNLIFGAMDLAGPTIALPNVFAKTLLSILLRPSSHM
jgi:hypothetical protein